ncbi:MAG: hypothetical protein ABJA34_09610 [Pseudonocardiales bacterium]
MTAPARLVAGSPRPGKARPLAAAPSLRLVPQRSLHPPRAPFVTLVVGVLAAGLLGLLLLNTVMAEDSFHLHALQQQGSALDLRQQQLQRQIDALETPNALAARAQAQGMVPAGGPAFIRLSDGKILGVPQPAKAPVAVRTAPAVPAGSQHPAAPPVAAPKPAATAQFPAPSPVPGPR